MLMMPTSTTMLKDCGERAMEACEEAFGSMKIWSRKLPKQLSLGSLSVSMSPRSLTPVRHSDTCDSGITSCDIRDRLSNDSSDKGVSSSDKSDRLSSDSRDIEVSSSDKSERLSGDSGDKGRNSSDTNEKGPGSSDRFRSARRSLSRLRSKSCERWRKRQRHNQRQRSRSPEMVVVTPGRITRIIPCPVAYNGPFIGRARAKVDYVPSPYDMDALRFKVNMGAPHLVP